MKNIFHYRLEMQRECSNLRIRELDAQPPWACYANLGFVYIPSKCKQSQKKNVIIRGGSFQEDLSVTVMALCGKCAREIFSKLL